MSRFHFVRQVLFLCIAGMSRAEEVWWESPNAATSGAYVTLALAKGSEFGSPENAVTPESVVRVLSRVGGREASLEAIVQKEQSLDLRFLRPRAGLAVFAVELKPDVQELSGDAIERRLRFIHADEKLRARWSEWPEPRRWRERRTHTAKIIARTDAPAGDDRTWAEPIGLPVEMIPARDPSALRVGEELPVRVLKGGKPLPHFAITFVSEGEDHEHVVVTDEEGRGAATLDAPGRWLLRGVDLQPAQGGDREWDSVSTTLVVNAW